MAICKPGLIFLLSALALRAAVPSLDLAVRDAQTGEIVPCRVHLRDAAGQPVRAQDLPFWRDHFVCPGRARLSVPPGKYTYTIERGPEYSPLRGTIDVAEGRTAPIDLSLQRAADLAREGWWSGDLHVHRPPQEIQLLMAAEDLHVAPVITWWNNQNRWRDQPLPAPPLLEFESGRFAHLLAGEDERGGGALLFFHLPVPLALAGSGREFPSPMKFIAEARRHPGAWIDIEKPFWWDAPVWIASGQADSIGLANNHMCRDQMYESEAWGRPRDTARLPPPRGNGFWTQEIYYHLLEAGVRLPPSAGSASGVLPNPVGYNRVYVYLGKKMDYSKWWAGLRAGRSFVSNGPLLRVKANGRFPGHVFRARAGKSVTVEIQADLDGNDSVPAIEIIRNGRVERSVPIAEPKDKKPSLTFDRSGWFLIRAIADNPKTFRFASTAPYYVEIGAVPRISRTSAQFFLEWVRERIARLQIDDPDQREQVLGYHRQAERFWREKVRQSTAD